MSHSRLEQLVLAIGGAAILGSLAVSFPAGSQPEPVEIVAQVLLLGVLFAAVRYGRRGGAIAACVAIIAYAAMRVPTFAGNTPTTGMLFVMLSRVAAFGIVGVAGGEASRHILYSIARLEGGSALDEWSRVFNERYFTKELEQALGRFTRYGEPFTVVLVTTSPALLADLSPSRQRWLVRTLADSLRADIRMVDEVARLDDGRFVVLLPHTPKAGGSVVCDRLAKMTKSTLGARDEAVTSRCLSAPDDEAGLRALHDELAAHAKDDQAESDE